ncbi:hypothetical protein AB0J72_27995 [Dactylosporangium sp. NPDC049742]|uniref:hypothetical protein n=1 Tax=Dactylosporangium sp. NPDC049742 TaxID=3154737 RepID=UPI00344AF6BF
MAGQDSYVDPAEMTAFVGRTHGVADRFETMRAGGAGTDVTDVQLDPRAMRFGSRDLAADILQAVKRAQDDAAELSKEAVKALLDPVFRAGEQRRYQDEH